MKLLIAGAGIRGKRIQKELQLYDLKAEAFIDSDKSKWEKQIVGIMCYPLDYFVSQEQACVVLVSPEHPDDLYITLCQHYSNVLKPEVTELILNSFYNAGYEHFFPIAHFYSLYPNASDICKLPDYARMDEMGKVNIPGIDLNLNVQKSYLDQMMKLYPKVPKWKNIDELSEYRFRMDNTSFVDGDAVALFCMLNILRPRHWIEVGSGWTSALTLDVNEYCLDNTVELTFIEPYADTLREVIKTSDHIHLIEKGLQEIEIDFFDQLEAGDVLFIDSTHVSKAQSDVNYLFFHILPRLKSGVIIHLHDIFFPFEYPHEWTKQGFVLNELFLLRSFLQYNEQFEILYFQNQMEKLYRIEMESAWPFEGGSIHGGSFWMRKK